MDFELIEPDAQDAYDPVPFLNYARARRADKGERDAVVADTVHYWDPRDACCRAAIVTQEDLETVELTVWPPGDSSRSFRATAVGHDETKAVGGSWHWPCGGH